MLIEFLERVIAELIKVVGEILLFAIMVMLAIIYHIKKDDNIER